jgi:hypothetical protein
MTAATTNPRQRLREMAEVLSDVVLEDGLRVSTVHTHKGLLVWFHVWGPSSPFAKFGEGNAYATVNIDESGRLFVETLSVPARKVDRDLVEHLRTLFEKAGLSEWLRSTSPPRASRSS